MTAPPASAGPAAALRDEPADPVVPERAPLPVTVIGGYLGAGKTTLVNRWLRHALTEGRRVAVLVNDFGELGIDADLIVAARDDVLELAGGCVCCSFGSDLIGALLGLLARRPVPDQVLIETSGVALPGSVAQAARLARDVSVGPVLVLVDALSVIERAHDRYVGDTITRQLAQAGRVLVSRTDLADPQRHQAVWQWLADAAPGVPVAVAADEAMPAVTDLETPGPGGVPGDPVRAAQAATAATGARSRARGLRGTRERPRRFGAPGAPRAGQFFVSVSARFAQPLDAPALTDALADPALGLERAKALVTGLDGARWLIELAGGQVTRRRADGGSDGASAAARGDRLVGIGAKARLNRAALIWLIERFGGRIAGQSR